MTFRAIDISGLKPATLRDQPAPVLQWVPLAQVVIDERYQRTITDPDAARGYHLASKSALIRIATWRPTFD